MIDPSPFIEHTFHFDRRPLFSHEEVEKAAAKVTRTVKRLISEKYSQDSTGKLRPLSAYGRQALELLFPELVGMAVEMCGVIHFRTDLRTEFSFRVVNDYRLPACEKEYKELNIVAKASTFHLIVTDTCIPCVEVALDVFEDA